MSSNERGGKTAQRGGDTVKEVKHKRWKHSMSSHMRGGEAETERGHTYEVSHTEVNGTRQKLIHTRRTNSLLMRSAESPTLCWTASRTARASDGRRTQRSRCSSARWRLCRMDIWKRTFQAGPIRKSGASAGNRGEKNSVGLR
jgi:hypothetical protein